MDQNKRTLRKPRPIPNIQDMLLNLEGFQWATSPDLNIFFVLRSVSSSERTEKQCMQAAVPSVNRYLARASLSAVLDVRIR